MFHKEELIGSPEVGADEKVLEQARLEAELTARKQADDRCKEASSFLEQGCYREAIPKYNQALSEAERIKYPEVSISALKDLARCYFHLGHMEIAQDYMQRASNMSVLTRAEEVFLDTINRKLWHKEGRRRRVEGF